MRKPQASGRRPTDRIILRGDRAGHARQDPQRSVRPGFTAQSKKTVAARRGEVTMAYQMGFTSGPSN